MNLYQKVFKVTYNSKIVDKLFFEKKRKASLKKEFILSKAYSDIMLHNEASADAFNKVLNDAEIENVNYDYRHRRMHKILGCWRWKGLWQNREYLASIIFDPTLRGIDFGGANGPVSLEATIVDFDTHDTFGREVKVKNLSSINGEVDFVFTSHTLEHIVDLDSIFQQIQQVLKHNGEFIVHVPAYTCERWRPGIHENKKFNDHQWAFALEDSSDALVLDRHYFIDTNIAKYFTIQEKKYVGDNSIFIIAKNSMK